jgi:hypothetical protein
MSGLARVPTGCSSFVTDLLRPHCSTDPAGSGLGGELAQPRLCAGSSGRSGQMPGAGAPAVAVWTGGDLPGPGSVKRPAVPPTARGNAFQQPMPGRSRPGAPASASTCAPAPDMDLTSDTRIGSAVPSARSLGVEVDPVGLGQVVVRAAGHARLLPSLRRSAGRPGGRGGPGALGRSGSGGPCGWVR